MNVKEKLFKIWEEEKKNLDAIDPIESEKLYEIQLERLTEVEKRITDIEKAEIEAEEKEASRTLDAELKYQQMESDKYIQNGKNRTEKIKVGLTVGAALITAVGATLYENCHVFGLSSVKAALKDLLRFK